MFKDIVEERADVRPGIRGSIVTIETTHASIATIVSVAESNKAAKTGAKEFHLHFLQCKVNHISAYIQINHQIWHKNKSKNK